MKSRKLNSKPEKSNETTYRCLKCSYVFNKKSSKEPPTFCPNCAINHLKGEIVRIMQPPEWDVE